MAADWKLRTVDPDLVERYIDAGWWNDDTLGQLLARGLRTYPDLAFTFRSDVRPWSGTYADMDLMARRIAGELQAQGVGPGSVVSFQLPNWMEAAATFYAVCYLGAVIVPIVHFYGAKELGYILRRTGVEVFVTTRRFGHQDFLANLASIAGDLPDLRLVYAVGDDTDGHRPFDELLAGTPIDDPVAVDPDSPALVAYTSGTTSDPKGVIHTHRTIGYEIRQLSDMQSDRPLPTLVGAPVGHGIGLLSSLLLPPYRGQPIHLIDVWDPKKILQAMLDDGLTAGSGATYFLTSLLDHPDFTPAHLELMQFMGLGGSAVPAAVTERARDLGISIVRSFGSTEHPSITGNTHDKPEAKKLYTDGAPLPGVEIRLVDEDGHDVPTGDAGEILSRGPECFAGYTVPELTEEAFTDGWFHTGDIGVLDEDGYLAITDRKKDIIIRGGENISAQEIEEILLHLPGVAECAVVAAPDARLGEHACAFLRMQDGVRAPDLAEVKTGLDAAGLARQKWPEELHVVEEFPRTPSGKIQKFVLRKELRAAFDA
ncbi:MAG: AMP-dependent synthetase and ligase [Actinomycetia bacterium]|nr:AMP-dependent synthetase and ligase [Actinomycetes bacterium]